MSLVSRILEQTFVYRIWQAPFADQKFAPVLAHNDLRSARRVLDVGCGPGTNTSHFAYSDYLGIDLNERYLRYARARHGRNFVVADVCAYVANPGKRFDFILVNSFLHHLNDEQVLGLLRHLRSLLTEDGYIHILELVLPERASVARFLVRWDRGRFARPLGCWRQIFLKLFAPVLFEPYPLNCIGTTLWHMVYFKGQARK